MPRLLRQCVQLFSLQNDIQIAAQYAVLMQRHGAEDLLARQSARIIPVDRHHPAAEKLLNRRNSELLPFDMPRRGGIREDLSVRGENVEFHTGVKGHQPIEQRLEPGAIDLPLGIQQCFALGDVLRQPAGQTLHHGVAVLHAGPELHRAGHRRTARQQEDKQQGQAARHSASRANR